MVKATVNKFYGSQNVILRLIADVKTLKLECTHTSLFQDFCNILFELREVRTLQVSGSQRFGIPGEGVLRNLNLGHIQKVIAFWPHLTKSEVDD